MARKTQVILTDDVDGSEATQTVSFALDGVAYEIDLNDSHAGQLREQLGT
ncbi:histone-like nucleoid-structuring protein Lsr2 [Brachybacterium paraconglomeratum]